MITTRFYLDCRAVSPGSPAPLRLAITSHSVRAFVPLSISLLPSQWDSKGQRVVGHPQKAQINSFIIQQKLTVDNIIFRLIDNGELSGLRACQIKDRVLAELNPTPPENRQPLLSECVNEWIKTKSGRTAEIYIATLTHLKKYTGKSWDTLRFDDITKKWLDGFDAFMAKTSPSRNARNIHLRNIRAVFNYAIDNDMTLCYPFRKFKIKPEKTQKRSMSVLELRKIANTPLSEFQTKYRDMWMLSFMLIGINIVDLCSLREIDGTGRVQYIRSKTHRDYSIRIEPEAAMLIKKYQGKNQLLYMLDRHKSYRTYYNQLRRGLESIKETLNSIDDGVKINSLTSYWARHTWATIAADLEIPKETIAAALGHGGNSVTDIYIRFDYHKVDVANRRVLDWVLYGKR